MNVFKEGDVVVRTIPFQDDEVGEPIAVGEEFTIALVHEDSIAFSIYGKSYKAEYFSHKELNHEKK